MSELYVSLAAVGGLLLILGMLGGLLKERTFVSEPLIALLAGVLLGPAVFGLLDLADLGNQTVILEEAALVTLGVALVGVALRLPVGYTSSNWRLLVVLLGIVMPLMWLASGLLVYLILGLPFWVSVLIGAIVTPTDPVVASSIVAGGVAERNLPASLRHAISAESGFNDGLALPFVVLPVLVLTEPPGEALSHWLTHTVLLEIAAGAVLAAVMGYLAGKTLRWAERKETMERTSLLTISLALSLTVLGVTELLHLNGVLAAFVAGIVFNFAGSSDAKESQEEIQEAISRFFDLPIFVLLGMAIPWEGWIGLGWSGLLLGVAVLLLRRLPAVLTLRPLLGPLRKGYDVLFLGWFGPVGAAALYYAAFSLRETGIEEVWVVGSLIICASVMVHGVTATPLTKLYGRYQ
ncbi:MAG: cation:proton antiporter [Rubrobacteraceae bacterium]